MGNSAVARAMDLLDLILEQPRNSTELAEMAGIHRTSVTRTLSELEERRYVRRDSHGCWRPGFRLLLASQKTLADIDPQGEVRRLLLSLSRRTGQTCHYARLIENSVIYVDKVDGRAPILMASRIGAMAPINTSGVAKAILSRVSDEILHEVLSSVEFEKYTPTSITDVETYISHLQIAKQRGWAEDDGEREPYLYCLAVPVIGSQGEDYGAVSITAFTHHTAKKEVSKMLPTLRDTCVLIGAII